MLKFENTHHQTIEVLNYTRFVVWLLIQIYLTQNRYIPCHLNRQIITLLSSLGVPDAAFEKLQQKHLQTLLRIHNY